MGKLRGHEVTAVGWSWQMDGRGDNSTSKPLLVGTSKGIIFELEISSDESIFTSTIELYTKQVPFFFKVLIIISKLYN